MRLIQIVKNYTFIVVSSAIIFLILFILAEIITRQFLTKYLPTGNHDWRKITVSKDEMKDAFIDNEDNWIHEFLDILEGVNTKLIYSPFKIYRFSGDFKSKYINVIDGERVPFVVNNSSCKNFREINIYGGSAVAGDGWLRDQDLLNHQIGKILETNGYDCFKFYNKGHSGYNSRQNFIKFFEIDKSKNGIHIFYDGVNDFIHNIFNNESHLNQNQYEMSFNILFGLAPYKEQFLTTIVSILNKFKFIKLISNTDENEKKLPTKLTMSKANELCKKWASRSNAIFNETKINNSDAYFIWQITIDNLPYLKNIERDIKEKTTGHLGDIFDPYEIFRDKCLKEFKNKDLKLHVLPNLPNQNKVLFFDYVHLNPPGNKILANNIFNIIKNKF